MACLGLLSLACPGALEDRDRFLPPDAGGPCTVDDVEPVIFARTCGGEGCHETVNGTPASNNLDLILPGIKARIKPQVSSCSGIPMAAYLLEKVAGSKAACAGSRMPLGKPALSSNEIACITDWVVSVMDAGSESVDAGSRDGGM